METQVWHKVEDKQGAVLALIGDTLYRFGFSGKNARQEAAEAVSTLAGGQDPAGIKASESKAVPVAAIQRVEVSHDRDTVRVQAPQGDKTEKVEFTVQSGDDAVAIARTILAQTSIDPQERSEDISVFEALLGPVILGVIAGVILALIYTTANGLESGEDINPNKGSLRGRGLKRLAVFVAGLLGTKGTIAVGAILGIGLVAWAVRLIVKRPQRLAWGAPRA